MYSYLDYLECSNCCSQFDPDRLTTYCNDCKAPIFARYDLSAVGERLTPDDVQYRRQGMWRWHEVLPVKKPQNVISLGEGDTPIIKLNKLGSQLGYKRLYVKDESLNPTVTFKARGLAAAISKAGELGVEKVIIPSAGNAGGAMAAYAARAGMDAYIVMPRDTPKVNIEESRITGAHVELIDGLINDAAGVTREKCLSEGWFDLSTFKEPYRVEGKKIMGYELAESFGWKLPEVIIYPTGGGTGLVGMWKAFEELLELGWLRDRHLPRIVAVQAAGCAPVVKAFESGQSYCEIWHNAETIAAGLRVPKSFADKLILKYIHQSRGIAIAVSDQSISKAQGRLAKTEGIFAAPEGAATLAGLINLIENDWLDPDEDIVLFNTGSGIKYLDN